MIYTITDTSQVLKEAKGTSQRIIKFRSGTFTTIKGVIDRRKAARQTTPVEQVNVVSPQANPSSVVNIVDAKEAMLKKSDAIDTTSNILGVTMNAIIAGQTATSNGTRALKVKPVTLKGVYRVKKRAPQKDVSNPVINNIVEFPKQELPQMKKMSEMPTQEPREINITAFPSQPEVTKPYGGAPIYGATSVIPSVDREAEIPNTYTSNNQIASENITQTEDIRELEKLVEDLNRKADELDKILIAQKLEYDREQAEAQARRVKYLKAQAALLRQTINTTQLDIARTQEEIQRLRTESGYRENREDIQRRAA